MPSYFKSALAAYFLGVAAVSANYYPVGTGVAPAPEGTGAPVYPYHNGSHPYHHASDSHPDYHTAEPCETKTYTDSHGHVHYSTIPYVTKTVYAETCSTDSHGSVTTYSYPAYTTVVPAHNTVVPSAATGKPIAPTGLVATGAASSLQVSGIAAAAIIAAVLAL